jgi:hypothetical protein
MIKKLVSLALSWIVGDALRIIEPYYCLHAMPYSNSSVKTESSLSLFACRVHFTFLLLSRDTFSFLLTASIGVLGI